MCRLHMRDYQESVTTGQTHRQTDAGQSDPYVPLCFVGDTKNYHLVEKTNLNAMIFRYFLTVFVTPFEM